MIALLLLPAAALAAGDPTVEDDPALRGAGPDEVLPEMRASTEEAGGPPPAPDAEALLRRIDELERRVQELVATDADTVALLRARVRVLEEQYDFVTERRKDARLDERAMDLGPRFHADADLQAGGLPGGPAGAALAELRAGWSADLGPRSGMEVELLAEPEGDGSLFAAIDELRLEFEPARGVRVLAGAFWLPAGWWATQQPRGAWGFVPVEGPLHLRPERAGGPLPLHQIGVEAAWERGEGLWLPGVAAGVSNGRGRDPASASVLAGDADWGKAAWLRAWAEGPEGVALGVLVYASAPGAEGGGALDPLGAAGAEPAANSGIDAFPEQLASAYLAVARPRLEAVVEGAAIRRVAEDGSAAVSRVGFAELAVRSGVLAPYVAGDHAWTPQRDPLVPAGRATSWARVGLRVDAVPRAALKGEIGWLEVREHPGGADERRREGATWRVQLVAGF